MRPPATSSRKGQPRVVCACATLTGFLSAGVLGQRDILSDLPEALDVGAASGGGDVVVRRAVEDADRLVRHVHPVDEDPVAGRIEPYVAGEREAARRAVHRGEPLESGVLGRSAAARETHDDDPCRVDPGMLPEQLECTVRVADVSPATELVLVVPGAGDATAREAVDNKGGDSYDAELPGPPVLPVGYAP